MNTPEDIIERERYRRSLYPDMDDEEFFDRLSYALSSYGSEQRKLGGDEKIEEAIGIVREWIDANIGIGGEVHFPNRLISALKNRKVSSPYPTATEVKKVNGRCSKCGTPKEIICKCEVAQFHNDDS